MRKATALVTFVLSCNVMAFAQSSAQVGAWSVFTAPGRDGKMISLLQTTAFEQTEAQSNGAIELKLDAVCKHGKLVNIALETTTPVAPKAMSLLAEVPTTRVAFTPDEHATQMQSWAVFDKGHTLSPYSEARQGNRNHNWVESLSGANTLALEYQGGAGEDKIQARFSTTGIAQALASVGCSY